MKSNQTTMLCVGKPLLAHKDDPNAHAIQSVLDFIGAEVGLQEHLLRVKLGGIPPLYLQEKSLRDPLASGSIQANH